MKNTDIDNYITEVPESQQEILRVLRELIFKAVPEVKEQFKWKRPVYGLEKDFCYLQANKNHVNLGFYDFTKIDDSKKLLEGTGKKLRHVKIKSTSYIDSEVLLKMIKQSIID